VGRVEKRKMIMDSTTTIPCYICVVVCDDGGGNQVLFWVVGFCFALGVLDFIIT